MVYLVIDTNLKDRSMLVKAEGKEEVEERLRLKETQKIIGSFTDEEISVLNSTGFTVISS